MLRPRPGDDRGAYAVLYAILVVLLVGVVALVIDLAMLRMDRRTNRAAADSAALAGSSALGRTGMNPVGACEQAMNYVEADLDATGTDDCASVFAGSPVTLCSSGTPKTATEAVAGRTVQVTWPVPDSSALLDPDQEDWPGADVTQPASAKDGVPCQRIAVEIVHNRDTLFAGIWGVTDATTTSRSVGLAADTGRGATVSPLVVLDEHACNALVANGGASVVVEQSADGAHPGEVSVDSDGAGAADPHGACNGGRVVISASGGGQIKARGTTSGIPGQLFTLAGSNAYDPGELTTDCVGNLPGICPTPSRRSDRVTADPWVERYNCQDVTATACDNKGPGGVTLPGPHDYIDQWVAFATGSTPPTWTPPPGVPPNCRIGATVEIIGDAYLDCDVRVDGGATLKVTGSLIVTGDVDIRGCLLVTTDSTVSCTGAGKWAPEASPAATNDLGGVYIGGNLETSSATGLVFDQTLLYVGGRMDIGATNAGVLGLVAPYGEQLTCVPASSPATAPSAACFEDMALWAEFAASTTSPHRLRGDTTLVVDGTTFLPNGQFELAGSNFQPQNRAQFIASRLLVTGGGVLRMVPNASRSTPVPRSGGSLIR
ncbi:MAG TPA: pilus assembly protein TadG-related protein [Actinomycetes bacterium]|nr:pilus assembly protein TadG-related protein [Actinomycetes bacterium]